MRSPGPVRHEKVLRVEAHRGLAHHGLALHEMVPRRVGAGVIVCHLDRLDTAGDLSGPLPPLR